jgi:hypothetical protein
MKCEMIWKIWMKSEKIWKIWKKGKLNSEMIWKISFGYFRYVLQVVYYVRVLTVGVLNSLRGEEEGGSGGGGWRRQRRRYPWV